MKLVFSMRRCKKVARYSAQQILVYLRQAYRLIVYFGGCSLDEFARFLGHVVFVELACMMGKDHGFVACARNTTGDHCSRCAVDRVLVNAAVEDATWVMQLYNEIEHRPVPEVSY